MDRVGKAVVYPPERFGGERGRPDFEDLVMPHVPMSPGPSLFRLLLVILFGADARQAARRIRMKVIGLLSAVIVVAGAWVEGLGRPGGQGAAPAIWLRLGCPVQNFAIQTEAWLRGLPQDPRRAELAVLVAVVWLVGLWTFRAVERGCRPWPMAGERVLDLGWPWALAVCAAAWPTVALGLFAAHMCLGVFYGRATPALWLQNRAWEQEGRARPVRDEACGGDRFPRPGQARPAPRPRGAR